MNNTFFKKIILKIFPFLSKDDLNLDFKNSSLVKQNNSLESTYKNIIFDYYLNNNKSYDLVKEILLFQENEEVSKKINILFNNNKFDVLYQHFFNEQKNDKKDLVNFVNFLYTQECFEESIETQLINNLNLLSLNNNSIDINLINETKTLINDILFNITNQLKELKAEYSSIGAFGSDDKQKIQQLYKNNINFINILYFIDDPILFEEQIQQFSCFFVILKEKIKSIEKPNYPEYIKENNKLLEQLETNFNSLIHSIKKDINYNDNLNYIWEAKEVKLNIKKFENNLSIDLKKIIQNIKNQLNCIDDVSFQNENLNLLNKLIDNYKKIDIELLFKTDEQNLNANDYFLISLTNLNEIINEKYLNEQEQKISKLKILSIKSNKKG